MNSSDYIFVIILVVILMIIMGLLLSHCIWDAERKLNNRIDDVALALGRTVDCVTDLTGIVKGNKNTIKKMQEPENSNFENSR